MGNAKAAEDEQLIAEQAMDELIIEKLTSSKAGRFRKLLNKLGDNSYVSRSRRDFVGPLPAFMLILRGPIA
ncbi:hypothetical protein KUD11_00070 [Roseovarius sp. LXJ103]|uniref:hypothetical protein n=1 Tax=Roseovarius carneus TaxID=2853164 RepID=UPI000D603BB9|nr:hypothetical protein [Roseovarius carneus]MBZ8117035.1 hypothetical protein [Roseovarius carneus]PWE37113.1 hypothetical protein DD563_14850 [Pelagicola sp. LXJ1103]